MASGKKKEAKAGLLGLILILCLALLSPKFAFVYFSFITHFPLVEMHCLLWSNKHLTRRGGHIELFYLLK